MNALLHVLDATSLAKTQTISLYHLKLCVLLAIARNAREVRFKAENGYRVLRISVTSREGECLLGSELITPSYRDHPVLGKDYGLEVAKLLEPANAESDRCTGSFFAGIGARLVRCDAVIQKEGNAETVVLTFNDTHDCETEAKQVLDEHLENGPRHSYAYPLGDNVPRIDYLIVFDGHVPREYERGSWLSREWRHMVLMVLLLSLCCILLSWLAWFLFFEFLP